MFSNTVTCKQHSPQHEVTWSGVMFSNTVTCKQHTPRHDVTWNGVMFSNTVTCKQHTQRHEVTWSGVMFSNTVTCKQHSPRHEVTWSGVIFSNTVTYKQHSPQQEMTWSGVVSGLTVTCKQHIWVGPCLHLYSKKSHKALTTTHLNQDGNDKLPIHSVGNILLIYRPPVTDISTRFTSNNKASYITPGNHTTLTMDSNQND